jgi:hypothetical protein
VTTSRNAFQKQQAHPIFLLTAPHRRCVLSAALTTSIPAGHRLPLRRQVLHCRRWFPM